MNPVFSAELDRTRIADLQRDAHGFRLARDARRARRQLRESGAHARPGHPAGVLTSYALVLLGARSRGTAK